MTRTGRIYKIIHNQSNIVYVGSTFNLLRQRWQKHKQNFLHNRKNSCSIFNYFEKYGIENFKIILIKEYQIVDKYHLRAYEQLWINKLKSINKCFSMYFGKLSLRMKYLKNRKLKNKIKQTEEEKKEYRSEYYKKNKEKIRIRAKKNNSIKIECPNCKKTMTKRSLKRHINNYCKKQII